MNVFDWIEQQLKPGSCTSEAFIYDDMASQSGRSLPVIYQPFDPGDKWHWHDRGWLFDFLSSTRLYRRVGGRPRMRAETCQLR